MSLMHVKGLWLLLGILPIVLLYVLKTKRTKIRVPSTWLWLGGQKDLQARSPWKKLTREMTLLFELLALAALALALGAPACRGRTIVGQHVAIVLDLSASMQTRDDRTHHARIEDARATARRLVDQLGAGSDAMLVGAGRDARVLFALGRDRSALRSAIDHASAQEVEGDLGAGVTLAIDRLRPLAGERRVYIVTDGATARLDALHTGPIPLQLVTVGHPQDNVAIVRMDVRSARQGREAETVQAFALVANHGETPRDVYVTAHREGETEVVASRRLRIEPHQREPVLLAFPAVATDVGRGLVVDVSPHDALASDDVAYGRIPPGAQLPVVLVANGDSPWISRALASDPFVTLTRRATSATEPFPADALVVFEGVCPATLPAQNDVLVFAPPTGRCADTTVLDAVQGPSITSYTNTDERFRFLTMDGVHFASATPLRLGSHATEILRAGDHTLIADSSSPERAVTIAGIDVGESDWPLRASFVLFVRNVEELARAHRARVATGGGRTGEPLRIAVPSQVREAEIVTPTGRSRVSVTAGTAVIGETTRTGFYRVRARGAETLAPVNLLSDVESNLRTPPLHIEGARARESVGLIRPHEELAPYVALFAALFLAANLYWLTRRERAVSMRVKPVSPRGAS